MPPRLLRVRTCSFTAMSGPAFGSRMRCGVATRMSLSPRYLRAPRTAVSCSVLRELVVDLAVARLDLALDVLGVDRARRRRESALHARRRARRACRRRRSRRPCSLNASTGPGAPVPSRVCASSRTSLPVRSGFCSLPESANSFSMIFCVSTNHEWSWPVATQVRERAERVEAGEERHRQALARRRRATATTGRAGSGCRASATPGPSSGCPRRSATSGRR